MPVVTQVWTHALPMMQQTVLLTAIRGPDGLPKYGPTKLLLRWFRRCVLLSAMDGRVLVSPDEPGGGSFTGQSFEYNKALDSTWQQEMDCVVGGYLKELDAIPHHFQLHLMHAIEILGYKHPREDVRLWWYSVYARLVRDMHLNVELEQDLDRRLGDSEAGWSLFADEATKA